MKDIQVRAVVGGHPVCLGVINTKREKKVTPIVGEGSQTGRGKE